MSDTTEPITNVFSISSDQMSDIERNRALRDFHSMITPEFLTQLNDTFIRGVKDEAWKSFSSKITDLQHPLESQDHKDDWGSFMIGGVKRDDVMMVKMCASEMHSPQSMENHPLMQEKLTIIASTPAQPYLRVVR